ncbi:MAG: 3-oxoacyl-ACP reductase [Rhodospirillaceae bacterium]|nr:3-oxoacyl-ACP reductase [Rhodospirillaceae bacterium]
MDSSETMDGQGAIVTGGAKGIGLAIARRLAARGCRVVVWDRDLSSLDRADPPFVPEDAREVDVTDLAAVELAFAAAVDRLGQVHVMVNNAGINGPVVAAGSYPVDAWHQIIAIDLTGVFYGCRTAVPHMVGKGYGRIVNIASVAGKEGVPRAPAYSAAKAGVIGMSKGLARELATTGVTVNCIAPAITATELLGEMPDDHIEAAKGRVPMGRFCTVEEIATMTVWAASPACSFTTGAVFDVTGGRTTY